MKKYYGIFLYKDEYYVIRFKIKGSLKFDKDEGYFIDDLWYVRSTTDVISMVAFNSHPSNVKGLTPCCFIIDKKDFIEYRSQGIKRWIPKTEVIDWP